jgi:hypothetical protein
LPTDLSFFLEVRNPEWFVEKEKPDLFETLHNQKLALLLLVLEAGEIVLACI